MIRTNPFFSDTTSVDSIAQSAGIPPTLLLLFLLIPALFLLSKKTRRKTRSWPGSFQNTRHTAQSALQVTPPNTDFAAAQMAAISGARFKTIPLLNREEERLLPIIERSLKLCAPHHRVMAQTSLGELIRPVGMDKEAFLAINSKRLAFAIIDPKGHLVIAVEHQGSGHHQNAAFIRDAIKREVIRKAGATWIETTQDTTAESLRDQITAALGQTLNRSQSTSHAQRA